MMVMLMMSMIRRMTPMMSMMTMTPILPNPFWSISLYAALVALPFHQNWSEVKKSFHLILFNFSILILFNFSILILFNFFMFFSFKENSKNVEVYNIDFHIGRANIVAEFLEVLINVKHQNYFLCASICSTFWWIYFERTSKAKSTRKKGRGLHFKYLKGMSWLFFYFAPLKNLTAKLAWQIFFIQNCNL